MQKKKKKNEGEEENKKDANLLQPDINLPLVKEKHMYLCARL